MLLAITEYQIITNTLWLH